MTDPALKASFQLSVHNPDVLTCIANLSNDEVFTPPALAGQILDTLELAWAESHEGGSIWADSTTTFLDPFTKSGVFLREIVARLSTGLADEIPDLQERVDHILTKQVFGIGISALTSLLARRSVYCSKYANGVHSIATSFDRDWGNIWFERTEHTWAGERCAYCGANKAAYERTPDLESHAYAFTHTSDAKARIAQIFGADMQFDVIIGNPPYQLSDGGFGTSAAPIYHRFVEQAKALEPRFMSMIIPAKWYSGGKGLDTFRATMLADRRLRFLADFPDSRDAFSGVDVAGGICYFLWDRDNPGSCVVQTQIGDEISTSDRQLDEFGTFIRDGRALAVVRKVLESGYPSFATIVSTRNPFGMESTRKSEPEGDLTMYASGGDRLIGRTHIAKGVELIDTWKVIVSRSTSEHAGQVDRKGMRRVFSRIEAIPPGSVATDSYLVVGPVEDEAMADNVAAYLRTKFVRYLVSTVLLTQTISRSVFEFVPLVDFSSRWDDARLYEQFGLTPDEVAIIESQIKSMDATDAKD